MPAKELTVNDLPAPLIGRVKTICCNEMRDINKISFRRKSKNYMAMYEGDEYTAWGYFIKQCEID